MKNIMKIKLLTLLTIFLASSNTSFGMERYKLVKSKKYKLVMDKKTLRIFDRQNSSDSPVKVITNVLNCKFSPDKKYQIVGCDCDDKTDKTIFKIFNLEKGFEKPIKVINARNIFFSPHSTYLIVKNGDYFSSNYKIFDAKNLNNDSTPFTNTPEVNGLKFSNDEKYMITNKYDKTVNGSEINDFCLYDLSHPKFHCLKIKGVDAKFNKDNSSLTVLEYKPIVSILYSKTFDLGNSVAKNIKRPDKCSTIEGAIKKLKFSDCMKYFATLRKDKISNKIGTLKIFKNLNEIIKVASYKNVVSYEFYNKPSFGLSITQEINNGHIKSNLPPPFCSFLKKINNPQNKINQDNNVSSSESVESDVEDVESEGETDDEMDAFYLPLGVKRLISRCKL